MTITTPTSATTSTSANPQSDGMDSGACEPDVVLVGEWVEASDQTRVQVSTDVASGASTVGRAPRSGYAPRSWYGGIVRTVRSWRPSAILALLVVTAALLMLLDLRGGPTQMLRSFGQSTGGAAQDWADRVIGPVRDTPLRRPDGVALQGRIAELEAHNQTLVQKNSALNTQVRQLAEAGKIASWAKSARLDVMPARVVAVESGRLPNRSVTIDVGRRDGLEPNLAVVGQGALVGRLTNVGHSTSTVQLISDLGSRVWSRIVESQEVVVAAGSGVGIELEFVDSLARIRRGQNLVTMGSPDSKPYPAGIPIARVVSVTRNPGQAGPHVTVEPIAQLSALNVVGVVSPRSEGSLGSDGSLGFPGPLGSEESPRLKDESR